MKKEAKAGRPKLPTRSRLFSLRLHPPVIEALEQEADKREKEGPRPTVVAVARWLIIEGLKTLGHDLDSKK